MMFKHSSVESGTEWWFLYEATDGEITPDEVLKEGLYSLKCIRLVRFVKRFASEEELMLEAAVKYCALPVAV